LRYSQVLIKGQGKEGTSWEELLFRGRAGVRSPCGLLGICPSLNWGELAELVGINFLKNSSQGNLLARIGIIPKEGGLLGYSTQFRGSSSLLPKSPILEDYFPI